ncbi:MAG TPA: hypothetical protein VIF15_10670 [Polyangiaceae bacterium]
MRSNCGWLVVCAVWACSSSPSGAAQGGDGGITTCGGFTAPCASGETCIEGYCLAPTSSTCHLADDGNDGCGASAICVDQGQGPACYAAPPCPANGICPTPPSQPSSATCNTGALANKGAICIPDRCLGDVDCAPGSHCVRRKTGDVLGICYAGSESLQSDGSGAGWEEYGCEMKPSVLVGHGAPGTPCTDPVQCAPTCCSCQGGQSAQLAAKCTYGDAGAPLQGTCASPAEACAAIRVGGTPGTCTTP